MVCALDESSQSTEKQQQEVCLLFFARWQHNRPTFEISQVWTLKPAVKTSVCGNMGQCPTNFAAALLKSPHIIHKGMRQSTSSFLSFFLRTYSVKFPRFPRDPLRAKGGAVDRSSRPKLLEKCPSCLYFLPFRGIHTRTEENIVGVRNMSSGGNFRRFEGEKHAKIYAQYRPTYTEELYTELFKYCEEDPNFSFDKALDIACGSGQSTRPLTKKFNKVYGQDISQAQISQAKLASPENCEFSLSSAEDLSSIEDSSIDLITCAQSFHWFDFEKVYAEARRVLKKNGVLAVYGYGLVELTNSEATATIHEFWCETLHKYWPPEREFVNKRFHGIELPFENFRRIDELLIKRRMPLSSFMGYHTSGSAYQLLLKDEPETQVLTNLETKVKEIYCEDAAKDEDFFLDVRWPIFILLGRKTKI